MCDAIKAGIKPDEFWRLTLKEINLCFDAFAFTGKQSIELAAWTAWHVAALSRSQELPKSFKELISDEKELMPVEMQVANFEKLVEIGKTDG